MSIVHHLSAVRQQNSVISKCSLFKREWSEVNRLLVHQGKTDTGFAGIWVGFQGRQLDRRIYRVRVHWTDASGLTTENQKTDSDRW